MKITSAPLTRRDVLVGGATLALAASLPGLGYGAGKNPPFPKGFLWGAASAGHQIEGNNSDSDIWLLEQVTPTVFAERSGDACDSLFRWNEDVSLVKGMGLNTYRFSLEWARIEPTEGQFSVAMLDLYKRMMGSCLERGITPMVTFNHFTTPRWFAARGGWEAPGAPDLFARFCERAATHLGAHLSYATTLNEPNILAILDWLPLPFPPAFKAVEAQMLQAAAKATGSANYSVANFGQYQPKLKLMLEGHHKGYQAIKSAAPHALVGVSLSITDDQAVGPDSKRDAKRESVYGPWMEAARTASDFIGVQNYGRQQLNAQGAMLPPKGAELTESGEEYYPASLEGAVRYAHQATGKPVIVTENGISTSNDARRAAYIPEALAGLQRAMHDRVPVLGYVHWSLLDNFEWLFGYKPKFGLVAVDRETFKREVKGSARVLGAIAQRNGLLG